MHLLPYAQHLETEVNRAFLPLSVCRRVVNTLCLLCTSVAALSRHRVCPCFAQLPVYIGVSDTNLVQGHVGTTNVDILSRMWYPVQIKCAFDIWLRGDGPTPRLDPHSSPVRRPQGPSVHNNRICRNAGSTACFHFRTETEDIGNFSSVLQVAAWYRKNTFQNSNELN